MPTGGWIGLLVLALIGGAIGGFFFARWLFKRELQKNPPISEAQIRMIYQSAGRKPSEKDIRRLMNQLRNSN